MFQKIFKNDALSCIAQFGSPYVDIILELLTPFLASFQEYTP